MHAHEDVGVADVGAAQRHVETDARERARARVALAALIAAVAGAVLALAILLWVLWEVLSGPKATPFDADGVRCYRAADQMSCIKTAEPPR